MEGAWRMASKLGRGSTVDVSGQRLFCLILHGNLALLYLRRPLRLLCRLLDAGQLVDMALCQEQQLPGAYPPAGGMPARHLPHGVAAPWAPTRNMHPLLRSLGERRLASAPGCGTS